MLTLEPCKDLELKFATIGLRRVRPNTTVAKRRTKTVRTKKKKKAKKIL